MHIQACSELEVSDAWMHTGYQGITSDPTKSLQQCERHLPCGLYWAIGVLALLVLGDMCLRIAVNSEQILITNAHCVSYNNGSLKQNVPVWFW